MMMSAFGQMHRRLVHHIPDFMGADFGDALIDLR